MIFQDNLKVGISVVRGRELITPSYSIFGMTVRRTFIDYVGTKFLENRMIHVNVKTINYKLNSRLTIQQENINYIEALKKLGKYFTIYIT
ncbi:hypothetical protein CG709_16545 [Lachnotalea glycerini]|nr:hypothetical protein CG709_16545 [Lachnotalea glycerini]